MGVIWCPGGGFEVEITAEEGVEVGVEHFASGGG